MDSRNLTWNRPQLQFILNRHRIRKSTIIAGRGMGKSALIAELLRYILKVMPKSTWTIQGATFQQLFTRTLPGTFEFLEVLGFQRDVDYFINKQPRGVSPDKLPFYKPLKYDNYITIKGQDGYCIGLTLLSQESTSRGSSTDGIICDESLLLDQEKFIQEAKFTNRGHEAYYKGINLHHAILHFSSMPHGDHWLLNGSEYYKDKSNLAMQDKLIDFQFEWLQLESHKEKIELWKDITVLQQKIEWKVSKRGEYYSEWNIFDNVENLGLRYIFDMYKDTPTNLFLVEGLNKRLSKVDQGFYAQLNKAVHTYTNFNNDFLENLEMDFSKIEGLDSRQDNDCDTTQALHVGTDYGSAINWLIVAQKNERAKVLNIIKELYVKSPKILDHVIEEFCVYYRNHKNKRIFLYPDAEAFNRRANSTETYIDTTLKIFKKNGWNVTLAHRMRYNKRQNDTYHIVNLLLSEARPDLYKLRFNKVNCKTLLMSMEQTPAIDKDGHTKKDKSSELKLVINRELATDSTDAFDQIIYYLFKDSLKGSRFSVTQLIH